MPLPSFLTMLGVSNIQRNVISRQARAVLLRIVLLRFSSQAVHV